MKKKNYIQICLHYTTERTNNSKGLFIWDESARLVGGLTRFTALACKYIRLSSLLAASTFRRKDVAGSANALFPL